MSTTTLIARVRLKFKALLAPRDRNKQDELFRLAIESAPHGVVMVDAAGKIVLVNRELERAFSYTSAELIGQSIEVLLPERLRALHIENRHAFVAQPETRSMGAGRELSGRRKDGSEFPIEIGLNPLRDSAGAFVLATVVDITGRKAMEKALRQEEEQFRLAVESAPNGVVMVDEAGKIVLVNKALEFAFGYSRSEMLGMPIETLLPIAMRAQHGQYRRDYVAAPEARSMGVGRDLRGLRKDGSEFPIEIGLNPLKTTRGAFVLATVVDITARKRSEEAQRHSQKMEALGTLAGGIAHDFNNILAAIAGNARLALSESGLDASVHQSLTEIDKASKRAADLVRRILGFARQQESTQRPIALQPVVEEAVQLLRSTLPAAIAIHARFSPDVPAVSADPTQIHQIVMNLVTNAAHAVQGRSDARIDITLGALNISEDMLYLSPELAPGPYVRLSVADNGSGMDKETMSRIFDPYFTTKALGEGTGLGLSSVHGIIKKHGGAISVYSALGTGSNFHVYLPALAAAQPVVPDAHAPLTRGKGERILYLDDEDALVLLAHRMLGRLGYTVVGFIDPEEALLAFEAAPDTFDAVITDLSMPRLSGFDVAHRLLAIRPNLPVIVTTGYIRPQDQATAQELGLPELILKPNTVDDLAQVLSRMLHDRSRTG